MNKNIKYKKNKSLEKPILLGTLIRYFDEHKNTWAIKVNYKRIFLLFTLGCLILWILGGSAIFAYFKFVKKFDEIKFHDAILAPIKMAEIREKMGEFNIRQSDDFFAQKRPREAFLLLTTGVARSPNNLKARTKLALIHAYSLKNTEYASILLETKLAKAFETKNKEYILLTSMVFSAEEKSEKKSSLLLAKALSENIITEDDTFATLTKIFANKNSFVDKSIRYFTIALESFKKNKNIQQFIAKSCALMLLKKDAPIQAQKLLKDYDITSGEVFMHVNLMAQLHNGEEIEVLHRLNNFLARTKNPASAYAIAKEIHKLFGNQKEVDNVEKMEYLTMPTQKSVEVYLAIKNNDISKLEKLLDKQSPSTLLQAIKIASNNKNQQAISLCEKYLNKIKDKNNKILIKLSLCEAYLKLNNPTKSEEILLEVKLKNKDIKFDEIINFLQFAIHITTKNITNDQIKNFRSSLNKDMLNKLTLILAEKGYYNEALDTIDFIKMQNFPLKNELQTLFNIYSKLGDYISVAKLVVKYPNKCPIQILTSDNLKNPNSDKFIMLSNQERISLNSEIQKANKKMQQYKAMYNF